MLEALRAKIRDRSARIGVVGLGAVGLSVACAFARAGFSVVGVDRDASRVAEVSRGRWPLSGREPELPALLASLTREGAFTVSTDPRALASAHVVLLAVNTPVDASRAPDLAPLMDACAAVGPHLSRGALVVVESTVPPGTTLGVVAPALARASGSSRGEAFVIGHCPERVMSGRLLANLVTLARVAGGETPEVARAMRDLYACVVDAEVHETDCVTAELVKTAENAYRDVNIAFANELALLCEARGADFARVRALVNESPGRSVLLAGPGVGGHCIPKDPWLLAHGAPSEATSLVRAARAVNDAMPARVVEAVTSALEASGRATRGAVVAVLGLGYMEETGEITASPGVEIAARLAALGATVRTHDPWIPERAGDVLEAARGADAIVLTVAHEAYRALDLSALAGVVRGRVLFDARRALPAARAIEHGFLYESVGLRRA